MFADTWHGCFEVGLSMQLPTASASIFVERRRSVGPQVGKLMVSYALTVDNCASSDIAVLQNAAFADRLSSCLVYSEIVYPVRLAFATSDFFTTRPARNRWDRRSSLTRYVVRIVSLSIPCS